MAFASCGFFMVRGISRLIFSIPLNKGVITGKNHEYVPHLAASDCDGSLAWTFVCGRESERLASARKVPRPGETDRGSLAHPPSGAADRRPQRSALAIPRERRSGAAQDRPAPIAKKQGAAH